MDPQKPPGYLKRQRQRELKALKHKADQRFRRLRKLTTRFVQNCADANKNAAQAEELAALTQEHAANLNEQVAKGSMHPEAYDKNMLEGAIECATEANKILASTRQMAKKSLRGGG